MFHFESNFRRFLPFVPSEFTFERLSKVRTFVDLFTRSFLLSCRMSNAENEVVMEEGVADDRKVDEPTIDSSNEVPTTKTDANPNPSKKRKIVVKRDYNPEEWMTTRTEKTKSLVFQVFREKRRRIKLFDLDRKTRKMSLMFFVRGACKIQTRV
jgi:hypothetical protein